MINLLVVIASVRPGRVGESVANWFTPIAEADGRFNVEIADLKQLDLPFMDEPNMPGRREYTKEHTKTWSATVERADTFVFVTPEYNATPAPALKNAIDYLYHEWSFKPASFVSYGGVWAGARAVQALKPTLTQLSVMPVPEMVPIPGVSGLLDDEGDFQGTEVHEKSAGGMLDSLARWSEALKSLRQ
ncbi:MAG: NAD(P)H-dependent oxidoreductase [Solirubrobacterales bacterium]|nr:NAD(P)H-dependent oxidoreductase [Solirubrobacterales bacterium]HMT04509.1 NAD(P)H-dependent oxidoreductase [Solirubrobacterales bacterium]